MALKTGRTFDSAEVIIDYEKCTTCGSCTKVCSGDPLYLEDNMIKIDQSRGFGCIGCGQCVAVCPQDCIKVEGRTLSSDDFDEIAPVNQRADFDSLLSLMQARRSIRKFKDKEIEDKKIQSIIDAVKTAPMGIPPSDVEILVLKGRDKVQGFAKDIAETMYKIKWFFGPVMQKIFLPLFGRGFVEMAQTFIYPISKLFKEEHDKGNDLLLHEAPLAMYFHVSPFADPVDPYISATYAMLAAESLGLGTCMIGTPAQFLKHIKKLKKKYGIPVKNQQGIAVIFGYPVVKFRKSIKRSIGGVKYY